MARKHAANDELHDRRARPDRVCRGEGLEPEQEDGRNAAIKCAKVQTLVSLNVNCFVNEPLQIAYKKSAMFLDAILI